MSLESQLQKYYKTENFKNKVDKLVKTDKNFGIANGGTENATKQYAEEMKEYLIQEINKLDSVSARERFIKAIVIQTKFIAKTGWTIDIFFDKDEVTSNSLWWDNPEYEMGAYLPTLFANGYNAGNYVYGYNNSGESIRSLKMRQGYNFVKAAVDKFNKNHNKTKAVYNEIYEGGTLDRGELASLYF